ncbi:hypothetical protein F5148DRAFT_741028 [Russula earlei]|uniref:Uncharacterized protein n=1 Tax=Russula earlei TaxID=71964 RepID=A0ACC0UDA0_9AGAM|nr:hypothetical protein F5148DRAFT_741028 [Russula earlei]
MTQAQSVWTNPLNGPLFILRSEWPPVSQQPIVYLEGTPDHGQTRPTESGTILASQYDDHVGLVSVDRFAIIGWQEYLILDGTRYFSNATLHVVTDVDLRKSEELDAVTRFLDGPDTEILPPPQWELWLRDGNESTQGFIPVKVWIHHGARMVVSKHPGSDLVKHLNEGIDRMESEYHYWQYVMSHPVHALLPPEITAEAVDVLTCIYSSWLAPSPPHSRPPFSQEECQELLTQLRSFSHTSAQTRSLARTSVVSTVLVRVVAWRQGRHWDCGTFQDSRQSKNDPSDGASLTRTGGGFSISSFGSGLHVSWNDHIINVSAREVMYVVLLVFGFSLGRLLA